MRFGIYIPSESQIFVSGLYLLEAFEVLLGRFVHSKHGKTVNGLPYVLIITII